jgi:hypothetical protein
MSTTVKVSAGAAESINAPRQQSYLWTAVLIGGAVAACAISAWFYVDCPSTRCIDGRTLENRLTTVWIIGP